MPCLFHLFNGLRKRPEHSQAPLCEGLFFCFPHDDEPPHPGELLREDVIAELGLSVTETAERLGMSRVAFSRVLNGKAAVSPDLAIRLEMAGVSTARAWLYMQTNYDLVQAMKHPQPPVRAVFAAACPA